MTQYAFRHSKVSAFQWMGTDDTFTDGIMPWWLSAAMKSGDVALAPEHVKGYGLTCVEVHPKDTFPYFETAHMGDYVMRTPDGHIHAIGRCAFESMFTDDIDGMRF